VQEANERGAARHEVPLGLEIAAAWAWRIIVIGAAGYAAAYLLSDLSEVTVPVAIAVLLTALLVPAVDRLHTWHVPRALGSLIVVLAIIVGFAGLLTVAGTSMTGQFQALRTSLIEGLQQLQNWAHTGPLHLTDTQITKWLQSLKNSISHPQSNVVVNQAAAVGATVGSLFAGLGILLFSTYFFLYDGALIWSWLVRLLPKAARVRTVRAGRAAWQSLTMFVRATVLVALSDAILIMILAAVLHVPLVLAIGVLVFIGAFVPVIGAFLSGLVAVLVALVSHGPVVALIMLGGIVAVQQLESHVLQPFLMGRIVSVHPLAVIVAIAVGVVLAGLVGALLAVPFAASLNSVVKSLNSDDDLASDPVTELEEGTSP